MFNAYGTCILELKIIRNIIAYGKKIDFAIIHEIFLS